MAHELTIFPSVSHMCINYPLPFSRMRICIITTHISYTFTPLASERRTKTLKAELFLLLSSILVFLTLFIFSTERVHSTYVAIAY